MCTTAWGRSSKPLQSTALQKWRCSLNSCLRAENSNTWNPTEHFYSPKAFCHSTFCPWGTVLYTPMFVHPNVDHTVLFGHYKLWALSLKENMSFFIGMESRVFQNVAEAVGNYSKHIFATFILFYWFSLLFSSSQFHWLMPWHLLFISLAFCCFALFLVFFFEVEK